MRFLAVSGTSKIKESFQLLSIHLSCRQILNYFYTVHKAEPQTQDVNVKCIACLVHIFHFVISSAANSISYCKDKALTKLQLPVKYSHFLTVLPEMMVNRNRY